MSFPPADCGQQKRPQVKNRRTLLIVLPSCPVFPPTSPLYHTIAYFLWFTLFLAHFLHLLPAEGWEPPKYLGRSPHFPDGFSKTSTTVHPGCSWGGTPWQILFQSSGRIVLESRPQSGRSACPGPPEHNKPRTTAFIQITTKLLFFSEHTKQQWQ